VTKSSLVSRARGKGLATPARLVVPVPNHYFSGFTPIPPSSNAELQVHVPLKAALSYCAYVKEIVVNTSCNLGKEVTGNQSVQVSADIVTAQSANTTAARTLCLQSSRGRYYRPEIS